MDPSSIGGALARAAARLSGDSPRLDAEVLLAHCLQRPRSHLTAWPEKLLGPGVLACFGALVDRRAAGEPVAYLTGRRDFWSFELEVTVATLIPRSETETLVERSLGRLPSERALRVADLGTGSGAVALALATERPHSAFVATDISAAALAVAERNRQMLGCANLRFVKADWCEGLATDAFDLVVANPPYVATGDSHLRHGDLRFEPRRALAAGRDGLDAIRLIVDGAARCLATGWLLMEHGYDQGAAVRRLLIHAGFKRVHTCPDLAGRDRVTEGWWPGRHRDGGDP